MKDIPLVNGRRYRNASHWKIKKKKKKRMKLFALQLDESTDNQGQSIFLNIGMINLP
jgi:hypothetical protein